MRRVVALRIGLGAVIGLAVLTLVGWRWTRRAASASTASYIGANQCASCHSAEARAWKGSHHDLAMQSARDGAVLGNFSNATFTYNDVTSTFFRRADKFMVHTDGPNGTLQDFEIKYTFGVEPLQQYLIEQQ